MKSLLRSCFVATPQDNKELLYRNFNRLYDSALTFDIPEDTVVFEYIKQFIQLHLHVPDITTLRTHFLQANEDTILQRLDILASLPCIVQGDFETRLETRAEERRTRVVTEVLRDAASILTTGMEVTKGREKTILKGPSQALHYVLDKSYEITTPTNGSRLSGEVTTDGEDFQRRYERIEKDPQYGVGQHTGLMQIDAMTNGVRKGELWILAGYTGHGKSLGALNFIYTQAVYLLHSSIYFSLEMPYEQVRNIFYAMHSCHPKFRILRYFLGLQHNLVDSVGVDYSNIRDGKLSPNARRFLFDYVVPDFNGQLVDVDHHPDTKECYVDMYTQEPMTCTINPENGEPWPDPKDYGKIHIEIADPDKMDYTISDLKHRAELVYSKNPFKMIVVDHMGLLAPRRRYSNQTEAMNEVIRDMKKISMSFNRGAGIAVLGLYQINRDGMKNAIKMKEKVGSARYELYNLASSAEAERSADMVISTWLDDDLKRVNRIQFQCLKSRDNKPFDIFLARIEWPCRRMMTSYDTVASAQVSTEVKESIESCARAID